MSYYETLGVKQNASTKQIKIHYDLIMDNIKKSTSNEDKIKKLTKKFKKSYEALSDYHTRQKLDNYLNNQTNDSFYKQFDNMNSLIDIPKYDFLSNSFENMNKLINSSDISKKMQNITKPDNVNGKYYYHTSYTSSKLDDNGNRILEQKYVTNNDGKVEGKHTITEKDKEGNDIVKEIPLKLSKYLKENT